MPLQSNNSLAPNTSDDLVTLFYCIIVSSYSFTRDYLRELRELSRQNDNPLGKLVAKFCKIRSPRLTLSIRLLRRLKFLSSKRINIRVNNSICSSPLKRELYQYSDRKSAIHSPRERTHHRTLSLLNHPCLLPDRTT